MLCPGISKVKPSHHTADRSTAGPLNYNVAVSARSSRRTLPPPLSPPSSRQAPNAAIGRRRPTAPISASVWRSAPRHLRGRRWSLLLHRCRRRRLAAAPPPLLLPPPPAYSCPPPTATASAGWPLPARPRHRRCRLAVAG